MREGTLVLGACHKVGRSASRHIDDVVTRDEPHITIPYDITCPGCGTVSKQAVSGGGVTTLASNQSSPNCLAVDATYVYFGTSNALKRIAK